MAGIYIHIPFCKTKCGYCNFFSLASSKFIREFHEAIIKEADLHKGTFADQDIHTIYFGGGTPSMLNPNQISDILKFLHAEYNVLADAEITLEANPDDCSEENLAAWQNIGINRLSIGIQSFREQDLIYLQRNHKAESIFATIQSIQKNGFNNFSLDLIYGIPGLNDDDWRRNIIMAAETGVEHISAYALTIEANTALSYNILKNQIIAPDEDAAVRHFKILQDLMPNLGFEHYEISNFARNKKYSRHNTAYWTKEAYLGLGPSAHSYFNNKRWWNISSLNQYLSSINNGVLPSEYEVLDHQTQFNEYLMTGLRTQWGVSLKIIEEMYGKEIFHYFLQQSERKIKQGILFLQNEKIQIHRDFWIQSDGIIADLMLVC
ncbi:MAG: radical SAM family heme chaperone HemW [Bacteroidales bacterium]|nr:radical SAM family heme chaperone HemW [Bacteroidales bacterium]